MVAFSDSRIIEASGLACATNTGDRCYVINDDDPGSPDPTVFRVQLTTGNTLGTSRITGVTLVDSESLATDRQGRLWLADVGDNSASRSDCAIYMRAEPGDGNLGALPWARFPITYPGGARNAEAFVIQPVTNDRYVISKEAVSKVYRLPSGLRQGSANTLTLIATAGTIDLGANVTDAVFSRDGKWLFSLRDGQTTTIYVHQPTATTWAQVGTITMPSIANPEGIAISRNGLSLYVTEDKGSAGAALNHVSIPAAYQPTAAPPPPVPPATPSPQPEPCS